MKKLLLSLLWLSATLTGSAYAAEYSLESTLNPSMEYDDNVFLSATDKKGSFSYKIRPELMTSYREEAVDLSLNLGYSIERYTALSNLNTENPFVEFSSTFKQERSSWGISASYVQSNTRNDADLDTGDFSSTSISVTKNTTANYSYDLNEKNSLASTISYSETTFSTTDNNDNQSVTFSSQWGHQITERLNSGLNFRYSEFDATGILTSNDDTTHALSVDFDYNLSKKWLLNGQFGFTKLDSKTQQNNTISNTSSSGATYLFNIDRVQEFDTLSLSLNRSVSPTSDGNVNDQKTVSVTYSRNISETLSANIKGSYSKTVSATELNDNVREFINVSPSITWQYQRNIMIDFNYIYRQQKQSEDNTNAKGNMVFVTFRYNWDGLRASR